MSHPVKFIFVHRGLTKARRAFDLCVMIATTLTWMVGHAEDITTLDKRKYENVTGITNSVDALFFSITTTSGVRRVRVPFTNLPESTRKQYGNYDPYEAGLLVARQDKPMILGRNQAFRLADLEAAKKKAAEEKKLLGFIMTWDSMFGQGHPMGRGGPNDLAGFYAVFNRSLVLVFVRHEDELGKVPAAVAQGFGGPEEGGFAPNMAVVTEDCSQFVCEIPLGGKGSDGNIREGIFRAKIAEIKKFEADRKSAKKTEPSASTKP